MTRASIIEAAARAGHTAMTSMDWDAMPVEYRTMMLRQHGAAVDAIVPPGEAWIAPRNFERLAAPVGFSVMPDEAEWLWEFWRDAHLKETEEGMR